MSRQERAKKAKELFHIIPKKPKELVACRACMLVKAFGSFKQKGCENCPWIKDLPGGQQTQSWTTSRFEGVVGMLNSERSWVAKWQKQPHFRAGLYALEIFEDLPADFRNYAERENYPIHIRNTITA